MTSSINEKALKIATEPYGATIYLTDVRDIIDAYETARAALLEENHHTPGPWFIGVMNDCNFIIDRAPRPSNDDVVDIPDVKVIAKVGESRLDDANARLIAASPEMLQELKNIGHQTQIDTGHFNRLQRLIARIEAV